jgi:hypothetical protein
MKQTVEDVNFTDHAEDMLKERKFRREFIVDIVNNPDWKSTCEDGIWHAFRRVNQKVVRVVVKGKQKPYTVITEYYDRRLRK